MMDVLILVINVYATVVMGLDDCEITFNSVICSWKIDV
jgi:hypothetical protein